MAVITISRQVAALGDEIAAAVAKKMNYTFVDRKQIEHRIVELGFPAEKLKKYDERKPGFFASLVKDRDEYLNYLECAVLEAASKGNVILIGRGAFYILQDVPNLVSLRFVAKESVRVERLKKEFDWNNKQALNRIAESDNNRRGFHKSFYNLANELPEHFLLTLNTGLLSIEESCNLIESLVKTHVTPEKEKEGNARIADLLKCQQLVNQLLFDHHLNISFLRAECCQNIVTLYGISDNEATAEKAVKLSANILPSMQIISNISVVQNFKTFQ